MLLSPTHPWTTCTTQIKARRVSMRPAYPLQINRMVSMAVFFGIVFYTGAHSARIPKAKPSKTTLSTTPWSVPVHIGRQSKNSQPSNAPTPSTSASASPVDIRQGNSSGYASTFPYTHLLTSRPVIVNLALLLPDPIFCKQVHLEQLQRWTRNVARATEDIFLTGSSFDGPITNSTANIFTNSERSASGDSGGGPTLNLSWYPICRSTAAGPFSVPGGTDQESQTNSKAGNRRLEQRRETHKIGNRYPDSDLYDLFQDANTCVVIITPTGRVTSSEKQGHSKRDLHIDLQHQTLRSAQSSIYDMDSSPPATFPKVISDGDKLAYTWDDEGSENFQSKNEDYYHDISAMASILWQKSYIGASGMAAMHDAQSEPVFTLAATMSEMGTALAALLDHMQWQHVVVVSGKGKYWMEFGIKIFVELSRRHFKVKTFTFDSDILHLEPTGTEKDFSTSDKGIQNVFRRKRKRFFQEHVFSTDPSVFFSVNYRNMDAGRAGLAVTNNEVKIYLNTTI